MELPIFSSGLLSVLTFWQRHLQSGGILVVQEDVFVASGLIYGVSSF